MSVRVMSEVWSLDLPATQKLVLLAMADHADDDGGNAYPSVARLSEKCSVDPRTVQRTLRALEATGLLAVERHATQHFPTTYKVNTGVAICRGGNLPGRQSVPPGVTSDPARGGTVPPKPSGTIMEPSSSLRSESPKPSRQVPEWFELTKERFEYAIEQGLTIEAVGEEFEMFLDHRYKTPRTKWDLAWKSWARKAVQIRGLGSSRRFSDAPAWKNSRAPVEPQQNIPSWEETQARIRADNEERRLVELRAQARIAASAAGGGR